MCANSRTASRQAVSAAINVLVRLPQRRLLHLAHRVARQGLDHEHPLRRLEFREPPAERGEDRRFGELRARAGNDDRRHPLAEIGMRDAEDRALEHALDRVDLGLDLLRIDVEAAGDDEILGAADDVDVAVGVDTARDRR